jgi:O-antigen/teichoic acid export membrane protein
VSGVVGVFSAYAGFGLWALVIYNGTHIVISSVMMAIVDKWYPRFTFSVLRAKVLFNFGWKMLVSAVLCSLYYDIRSLIIGKKFSTEDLAYYDRGQQFPVIMSNTLDNAIQSVMFPVLARSQDEPEKLRESLKRTIALGMLIVTPVMVGLAVIAEPLIVLLLTDKWITAVPYMQLLCVAEVVLPLSSSNLVTVKAMGKSGTYMKLEMIRRIVMIAILLTAVFAFDSVLAIAISAIVIAWTDAIIIMTPMKKIIGYGVFSQLKDVWKTVLVSIIMGAIVFFVGKLALPTIALLVIQVLVGIVVYAMATWVFNKKATEMLLSLIKETKEKK